MRYNWLQLAAQQYVHSASAAVYRARRAKREDVVTLTQPVVDFGFQHGAFVPGALALAVNNSNTGEVLAFGTEQEQAQCAVGAHHVHAVEIKHSTYPILAAAQFAQDAMLDTAAVIIQLFAGIEFGRFPGTCEQFFEYLSFVILGQSGFRWWVAVRRLNPVTVQPFNWPYGLPEQGLICLG